MSSTSKQSEDDLLAEEVRNEGEEGKESLTDEHNVVLPRTSQLKNQTAAYLKEINLLTNARSCVCRKRKSELTPSE